MTRPRVARAKRIAVESAIAFAGATAIVGVSWRLCLVAVRRILTPPYRGEEDTRILAVGQDWISLAATGDAADPGRYGLWFNADRGHAKVGKILFADANVVKRELIGVDFGTPTPGMRARLAAAYFLSPAELTVPFSEAEIQTELGPAPAWFVPAHQPGAGTQRWVIMVHGRAAGRQEAVRAVPLFFERGWSSLIISYRNDPNAPRSDNGRYALGDAEWADVVSAIECARASGAEHILLVGWSMGGALILQAITRSLEAATAVGVILDSPVVDWRDTIRHQLSRNRLPRPLHAIVLRMIEAGNSSCGSSPTDPIDLDSLNLVAGASRLRTPIRIIHSLDDDFVPIGPSKRLSELRKDLVQLHTVSGPGHVRTWNVLPAEWHEVVGRWVDEFEAAISDEPNERKELRGHRVAPVQDATESA